MDYTQNLHLPQWEASDRIHHDDFNDAFAALDAMPRIVTGTYTGTGTYGSDHPNTLTFLFTPKLVLVQSNDHTRHMTAIYGAAFNRTANSDNGAYRSTLTWSGQTLQWYNENAGNANDQMNGSGTTYYYVAIG